MMCPQDLAPEVLWHDHLPAWLSSSRLMPAPHQDSFLHLQPRPLRPQTSDCGRLRHHIFPGRPVVGFQPPHDYFEVRVLSLQLTLPPDITGQYGPTDHLSCLWVSCLSIFSPVAVLTAWGTWSTEEAVCICVALTGSVLYDELKGLELFNPSSNLSLWLFEGH